MLTLFHELFTKFVCVSAFIEKCQKHFKAFKGEIVYCQYDEPVEICLIHLQLWVF